MLSRLLDEEECRMRREREQDATGVPSTEQVSERQPVDGDRTGAGNEPDA